MSEERNPRPVGRVAGERRREVVMFDVSKHVPGDVVRAQCCDSCCHAYGVRPKFPADSGTASWMCDVCGHYNIGSAMDCTVGHWLTLRPVVPPNAVVSGARSESA